MSRNIFPAPVQIHFLISPKGLHSEIVFKKVRVLWAAI
jgi:hypothetical protein